MFLINFLKSIFKRLVNSFRIPSLIGFLTNKPKEQLLAEAPPAKGNWDRLNLENSWVYFAIVFLMILLASYNKLAGLFINTKSKIDVLNYQGEGSPLTIVYKAASVIYLLDYTIQTIAFICLVSLVIYAWKRKK